MDKKSLRQLIAQDDLEKATEKLLRYTEELGEKAWNDQAVSLAAQYEAYEKNVRMGNLPSDDLQVTRNKIVANYIGFLNDLPDSSTAKAKPRGFSEEFLKTGIFITLLVGKLILFMWILFHLQTGGLPTSEAMSTAGFLLPIFVAYLTAIVSETVRNRYYRRHGNGIVNGKKRVRSSLIWITFTIIPIYLIAFWMIIDARARGNISAEFMTNLLTLTESGLGAYVGIIVFDLFKPKGAQT